MPRFRYDWRSMDGGVLLVRLHLGEDGKPMVDHEPDAVFLQAGDDSAQFLGDLDALDAEFPIVADEADIAEYNKAYEMLLDRHF